MNVEGTPFLVNVLTPLGFTHVDKLKSRHVEEPRRALEKQLTDIKNRGLKVKSVKSDPESGIMAIKEYIEIMGLLCDYTGKDEPVPKAVSKIRKIIERAQAIINTLPLSLSIRLISFRYEDIHGTKNYKYAKSNTLGTIS